MKYLGVNYIYDDVFKIYISGKGNYLDLESMKKGIRKLSLPTYQPTKTLKWLEEQTRLKWRFEYSFDSLYVFNDNEQWEECYELRTETAFVIDDKIGITTDDGGIWVYMSPREFITKIEKGEWI